MAKKKARKATSGEDGSAARTRVSNLIVVRESDVSDRVLMQSMVDKTLYGCSDIPGVALARTYGLDPFAHPKDFGAQVKNTSTHKMVLFAVDGTLFLYAMGSAAKEDSEEAGNDFLGFLMEILLQYQPEVMTLANITRLMRATKRVGELQDILIRVGCILRIDGGSTIDVRTPNGSIQFMMMISFAAFERDHIVMRMLAGLVASAGRRGMHFRPEHLPLGYVMQDKTVVPDLARKEDVAALLTILAQPMTRRQMAEAISDAGIRLHRSFGQSKSTDPADARDMKGFIKGIEQWLDLYETGTHSVQRENPFHGLDRIGTAPVVRENESDRGYITLNYKWGLPDGGWASDEVIAQARASFNNQRTYGTGATGHKIRKPFLGLIQWRDEESNEWKIDSHCLNEYRLRRRKYREGALAGWAEPTIDGEIVARIDAATLHRSVADGIQFALSNGVAVEHLEGQFIGEFSKGSVLALDQSNRRRALGLEADRLRKKAAKSRAIAMDLADDQDASPWIADAIQSERQAGVIAEKLNDLNTKVEVAAELEKQIPVDALLCARALSVLRRVVTNAPREVGDALRQILPDMTMEITKEGKVRWKVFVLLPSKEGALRLGPIYGEVEPVLPKFLVVRSPLTTKPRLDAALGILREGGSLDDVTEDVREWSAVTTMRHLREFLVNAGVPANVVSPLINARVPELRAAIIGAVLIKPRMTESDIPGVAELLVTPECSAQWIEHILRTYLFSNRVVFPIYWMSPIGRRQVLLDLLLQSGGEATVEDLQGRVGGGYTRAELTRELFSPTANKRQVEQSSCAIQLPSYKKVSGRVTSDSKVGLVPCIHCGGWASRLIVVPEVSGHLFCPDCRRMPIKGSPIFPRAYLDLVCPTKGRFKNEWANKSVSKAAKEYLQKLPEEQRAKMQMICRNCDKPAMRTSPGLTLCSEC